MLAQCNNKELVVMSSEVQKRVIKVSKEEAELFHNHHFGEIYNLTFSLLQKFFPK